MKQQRNGNRSHLTRLGVLGSGLALAALSAPACSSGDDDAASSSGSGGGSGVGGAGAVGGSLAAGTGGGTTLAGSGGRAGRGHGGTTSAGTGGDATAGGAAGEPSGTGGQAGKSGQAGKTGTSGKGGAGGKGKGGTSGGGTGNTSAGKSTAAEIATKLGRAPNFLVGMGNDLEDDHDNDGAYTLGVTLDIHYAYLVGLPGQGGWPDWNDNGTFVNILADSADAHGVTPMYDLYAMAADGEDNADALTDDSFMGPYWDGAKLLFQRLAVFDKPAIVHLEPDFWAYMQLQSNGDPTAIPVHIHGLLSECDDQPENLVGLGKCLVALSRMYAPKTMLGFHASNWSGDTPSTVTFLKAIGAADADFIGIDLLDRDAGCFEAHTDENCQRDDGPWYWDESNQTSPNFHEFLDYSKQISDGLGKPVIWWQIPFGVPSDKQGGTSGHYRDNRVHYIFEHIDEFVDAGGLGVTFGVGADNQTYITSDGGQFKNAVTSYLATPTPLP